MTDIKVFINGKKVDTDYFKNFNWLVFDYGEEVYLDDCDETNYLVARFRSVSSDDTGRFVHLTAEDDRHNKKSALRVAQQKEMVFSDIEKNHYLAGAKHFVDLVGEQPGKSVENMAILHELFCLVYKIAYEHGYAEGEAFGAMNGFDYATDKTE